VRDHQKLTLKHGGDSVVLKLFEFLFFFSNNDESNNSCLYIKKPGVVIAVHNLYRMRTHPKWENAKNSRIAW
jgi:hypothetical protein